MKIPLVGFATLLFAASIGSAQGRMAPFLPLAGGRSDPTQGCLDDRQPIYADALRWQWFSASAESSEQRALRLFLAQSFNSSSTSVFGLDETLRARLRGHILGTTASQARWLNDQLNASNVRLAREVRMLGWSNGVRASLLAENPNLCNGCGAGNCQQTAPTYGVLFTPSGGPQGNDGPPPGTANFLYPWPGGHRSGLTRGYAKLLTNELSPTKIEASNITAGDPIFSCQGVNVVQQLLPTSAQATLNYEVAIGPTGSRCIVCP